MKVQEMRDLTGDELKVRLVDLKEELFNLRFQAATGQLKNNMRIRSVRKDIARVMTLMRERELSSKRA